VSFASPSIGCVHPLVEALAPLPCERPHKLLETDC
jgi:hypothetical protein